MNTIYLIIFSFSLFHNGQLVNYLDQAAGPYKTLELCEEHAALIQERLYIHYQDRISEVTYDCEPWIIPDVE